MKNRLTILIIIIVAANICRAQDTVKRKVPLVKESAKIDSLLFSIINIPKNLKAPENDSCILLGLFKNNNDAGFISGLHTINCKQIIFVFSNLKNNKKPRLF